VFDKQRLRLGIVEKRGLIMRSASSGLYRFLKLAFVIVLLIITADSSSAASDSRQQKSELGLSNFAYEALECASYYSIAAEGLYRGGKFKEAKHANEIKDNLFELAQAFTPPETYLARLELVMNEQIDSVNGDYKNLSILIVRYGKSCEYFFTNIENRMKYHVEKSLAE